MSKNININSSEWCNLIFKNRNKAYGAYKMRQSSMKDHIIAFGITVLALLIMIWIIPTPDSNGGCGGFKGSLIELETPLLDLPLPPKMSNNNTIFYEPAVTPDNKIMKMTGDDKTGILYEKGEYNPLSMSVITIESCQSIHAEPHVPSYPHCPRVYEMDTCLIDNSHPIDIPPTYPGGNEELYKFLKKNLRYPAEASEKGIQGKVLIRFTVSKTGLITNIKILKSLTSVCDKEAIRLIENMPAWIPAKSEGKPVSINFILPIQFSLI